MELTKTQQEVLQMLRNGYTAKKIALTRGISERRVYVIKAKLRELGMWTKGVHVQGGSVSKPEQVSDWGIHGLMFDINPYYFYPRYGQHIGKQLTHREWTIQIHEKKLIMIQNERICHTDKYEAMRAAQLSINKTIIEVGNRYGFAVFKAGRASIKQVREAFAINPGDVAGAVKEYITCRDEDGKVWLTMDQSKGYEYEYNRNGRVRHHQEKLEPFLNDIRINDVPNPSESYKILHESLKLQYEHAASLSAILKILRPQDRPLDNGTDRKERASYIG